MKKLILVLVIFNSLISCKTQSSKERMKQDIIKIFNYIKTDNISELKKNLITKTIFKDYLREQIRLTSQKDFHLKMKDIYEKQLNKKISKEELDGYINKNRKQIEEMLNDSNRLNEYFKSKWIQDDYDIEYLNKVKNDYNLTIWKDPKLFFYYATGDLIFSNENYKKCYDLKINIIPLNDKFYFSLGDTHSCDCDNSDDKDMKNIEFIDFTK